MLDLIKHTMLTGTVLSDSKLEKVIAWLKTQDDDTFSKGLQMFLYHDGHPGLQHYRDTILGKLNPNMEITKRQSKIVENRTKQLDRLFTKHRSSMVQDRWDKRQKAAQESMFDRHNDIQVFADVLTDYKGRPELPARVEEVFDDALVKTPYLTYRDKLQVARYAKELGIRTLVVDLINNTETLVRKHVHTDKDEDDAYRGMYLSLGGFRAEDP